MRSERILEIEGRGKEDGSRFEFPMTLATDGEASDGHILSIEGAKIPDRMPLLVSHMNEPTLQLGSVVGAEKEDRRIRATGVIELEGDLAERRRDLAHMIERGHVRAVSVRWDGIKATPRRELDPKHPAHVKEGETDFRKRFGLYFDQWHALEGSVVSVGADPKALIGRIEAAEGDAVTFWRQFAEAGVPVPSDPVTPEVIAERLASALRAARTAGLSDGEALDALAQVFEWPAAADLDGHALRLPGFVTAWLETIRAHPVEPAEAKPVPVESGVDSLRTIFAEHRALLRQDRAEILRRATGRRV